MQLRLAYEAVVGIGYAAATVVSMPTIYGDFLLQVRRDALETRREYLERLLEAADAGVELASAN